MSVQIPCFVAAALLATCGLCSGAADLPSGPTGPSDDRASRLEYMRRLCDQYTIRVGEAREPAKLHDPLLRWNDPVIRVLDGITVIWTRNGRPVAAADVWVRKEGETHHVFQSLAEQPLVGERLGERVWYPAKAGLRSEPIPDAPPPSDSAAKRLAQMRALARRFSGHVVGTPTEKGGRIELRLLSQPVYRYGSSEAGVLDGAIFVLAKGTNPEAMLLVEAIRNREQNEWRFAVAPKTNREIEVRYNGTAVLSVPPMTELRNPEHVTFGVLEQGPAWGEAEPDDPR